jgi:hypothetical protein
VRRALPLTLSATASLVLAGLLPSAGAGSGDDSTLISDTNAARSQDGLNRYVVASDLAAAAERQAQRMAARGTIYHDPALGSSVCCWHDLGDNVGVGPDATSVHNAFMASSEHRANILSTIYTQVGIGSARGADGRLYVDEIFRRPSGAAPAVAAPAAAVPQQRSTAPAAASRSAQRVPTQAELLASRLDWLTVHYPPLPGQYDPVRQSLRFDAVMSRLSAQSAG